MTSVNTAVGFLDYFLQFVLVVLLFRGFVRSYTVLLIYGIVQLLSLTIEEFLLYTVGRGGVLYARVYWTDEVIIDLTLFLLVIALTFKALEGSPLRQKLGRMLGVVVAAAMVLPFLLFYDSGIFSPRWFNRTSQMLNFGAAVMNLALWTALAANRKRDARLLPVSAGLGVAVTGAAVYYGLRNFTVRGGTVQDLVDLFKSVSHLASVLIWCTAFWPRAGRQQITQTVATSHQS